jgi:hypothetical protein
MKAFVNTVQWMCQSVCNNVLNINVPFSRIFICVCVCVCVCVCEDDGLLVNPKYAAHLAKNKVQYRCDWKIYYFLSNSILLNSQQ